MGKELTDEWRSRVEAVNLERRQIREELDALGEQIRAPLTEWENAEKARIAAHEAALASICERPGYGTMETAAEIAARLTHLQAFPPREWQEFTKRAGEVLAAEIGRTEILLAAAQAREAEQAELARLRAEAEEQARQAAERARAEREERIAAEAAEAARVAAEECAAREAAETAARVEAERRRAAEAQQAAEREAARRAEEAAAAQRAAEQRAERLQAEAEAAAARAEEERIRAAEREERARKEAVAAEQRRAAEQVEAERREAERRAANLAHKTKINREVLAALTDCGLSEDLGKAVITSIARGEVPHVSLRY